MAEIELKSISKSFGSTEVIKSLDLSISNGEFITIVGPSGCGKSTLLRIIAGLENQSTGDVEIDGNVVNKTRASERDLAMVFQSYALYPHLTVQQNLMVPLKLRRLSFLERFPIIGWFMPNRSSKLDEIVSKVQAASETLQITHLLDRKPGQLSGGQQQRVAVGRAMVREPVAFLMDEPLSNLDAELRVTMRKELSALHEKIGGTMIYVTHDQVEAMTLADQIVVLNEGYVAQSGVPLELYNNPNDMFVAGFIGSPKMNFIKVKVNKNNDNFFLKSGSLNVQVSDLSLESNDSFSIGSRPEHILICKKEESDIVARVDYSEQLGNETYFYCSTDTMKQLIVHQSGQYKVLKGENMFLFDKNMPDEVIDELAWGSEAILTSTAAAAILIHNDGVNILRRGITSNNDFKTL